MGANDAYQQFMIKNASKITAMENILRSISYIIPGRFADSEFAAEVLYSSLNLLRLVTESAIIRTKKPTGDGITKGAWNAYIMFLRRKSKLLDCLLAFLNVTWTVEVPVEMLVDRLLGLTAKLRFVVVLEILKATSRLLIFFHSGWRPILRNFLPDIRLDDPGTFQNLIETTDTHRQLLNEIKLSKGEREDDVIRSFLRKYRVDAYVLVPELSIPPSMSTLSSIREIAHILRPLVYAGMMAIVKKGGDGGRENKLRWLAWTFTIVMDVFAEWPQLVSMMMKEGNNNGHNSPIERNERQIRMIKFLLYLLRDPFYSMISKKYLDSVSETLGQWRLLRPIVETAKSYQRLCEKVSYYTLGS